jgi:hypothetical protein
VTGALGSAAPAGLLALDRLQGRFLRRDPSAFSQRASGFSNIVSRPHCALKFSFAAIVAGRGIRRNHGRINNRAREENYQRMPRLPRSAT